MTNFDMFVQKDSHTKTAKIEPGQMSLILLDVDGVVKAS
jgi:hypothetical protein